MMNDMEAPASGLAGDERLLARLSRLRTLAPREGGDNEIAEELLRDLRHRCRRRPVAARLRQGVLGESWEAIVVLALFCLLGLDLARIIRWLLG